MKRSILIFFMIFNTYVLPFCCNGDGCPNMLVRYVDSKGNPTGHYALYNEFNHPVEVEKGPHCECIKGIGKRFPSETCPNCVNAVCPRKDCQHHIFQHTCEMNVHAVHGSGIIEVLEKNE